MEGGRGTSRTDPGPPGQVQDLQGKSRTSGSISRMSRSSSRITFRRILLGFSGLKEGSKELLFTPPLGESRSRLRLVLALREVYGGHSKKNPYKLDLPERSEGVPEPKNVNQPKKNPNKDVSGIYFRRAGCNVL